MNWSVHSIIHAAPRSRTAYPPFIPKGEMCLQVQRANVACAKRVRLLSFAPRLGNIPSYFAMPNSALLALCFSLAVLLGGALGSVPPGMCEGMEQLDCSNVPYNVAHVQDISSAFNAEGGGDASLDREGFVSGTCHVDPRVVTYTYYVPTDSPYTQVYAMMDCVEHRFGDTEDLYVGGHETAHVHVVTPGVQVSGAFIVPPGGGVCFLNGFTYEASDIVNPFPRERNTYIVVCPE